MMKNRARKQAEAADNRKLPLAYARGSSFGSGYASLDTFASTGTSARRANCVTRLFVLVRKP